jgi:hypothetical protein
MIYKREEYVEEAGESAKFPVRHIEVFTPQDGSKPRFVGQVALGFETPMGLQQIPVTFEIDALLIAEAFQKFEAAAEPKIEEARKQLEEEFRRLRRESQSRIVRPDELGLGGGNIIDFKKMKE